MQRAPRRDRIWLGPILLALVACGGSPEAAWPRSAGHTAEKDWKDDGGDSLEPRSGAVEVESGGARDPQPDAAPAADAGPPSDGGAEGDGGLPAVIEGELTIDVFAP